MLLCEAELCFVAERVEGEPGTIPVESFFSSRALGDAAELIVLTEMGVNWGAMLMPGTEEGTGRGVIHDGDSTTSGRVPHTCWRLAPLVG